MFEPFGRLRYSERSSPHFDLPNHRSRPASAAAAAAQTARFDRQ